MIALVAAVLIGFAALLVSVRLFTGPTLYDRLLAVVSIVVKTALLCAALGVVTGATAWVDGAFALAFAGLVFGAASLKFFRTRTFQAPLDRSARA